MGLVGGSITVVVASWGVGVGASRLHAVLWRSPETTAAAWSSPPRKSANSALSFVSVVAEVPTADVIAGSLSLAWAAERAAARQHASRVEPMVERQLAFMVCLLFSPGKEPARF